MGAIVSQLLAEALARRRPGSGVPRFKWIAKPMRPLVDLADKERIYAILDRDRW